MTFRADLHCHSTCSDGNLTPFELIDLACEKGLNGLSITDHDTVNAYIDLFPYAEKKGIRLITGVEFSTHFQNKSVHVLGYHFNPSHGALQALCQKHIERRKIRNLEILHKLAQEGFIITEEELYKIPSRSIGRPHIAELMVEKGFVIDFKRAFNRYLGDGKRCFAEGPQVTIEETLDAIHQAKGIAVIAHPHLCKNKRFVNKVLSLGFDGIECDYACMPHELNMPWHTLANELNLIKTAGSDFHGDKKPGIPLGASTVGLETFEKLISST